MWKNDLQLASLLCVSDLDRRHSCFDSLKTQHHKDYATLPKTNSHSCTCQNIHDLADKDRHDTKIRPFCKNNNDSPVQRLRLLKEA